MDIEKLNKAIEINDITCLVLLLKEEMQEVGLVKLSALTKIHRQTLYKCIAPNKSIRLKSFLSIVNALGYSLKFIKKDPSEIYTIDYDPMLLLKNQKTLYPYVDTVKNEPDLIDSLLHTSQKKIFWKCPTCSFEWFDAPKWVISKTKNLIKLYVDHYDYELFFKKNFNNEPIYCPKCLRDALLEIKE